MIIKLFIVYTISNDNEKPPMINDLIPLKVKVPKVKISKYFQDKYSPEKAVGSVLKISDSQFMSNKSGGGLSPNSKDYNYK